MHLMALVNGPAQSPATDESDIGNTNFDATFITALQLGYRVSPTGDQDNHNATWGASTQSRTAVLAHARTKSEILNGMAARRTYATQDHNVVVQFSAEGHAMGEAFSAAQGVRIAARVIDPDPTDAVTRIELLRGATGGALATVIAQNEGSSTLQWRELRTFDAGAEEHYFLRVRTADNQTVWTGPVYVTYDPNTPVAVGDRPTGAFRLTAQPNPTSGRVEVTFSLPNARAARPARGLRSDRTAGAEPVAAPAGGRRAPDQLGRPERQRRPGAGRVFFVRLEGVRGPKTTKLLVLD